MTSPRAGLRVPAPTAAPDEWGMVLTALTMLAGVGGIATRLGLTPDDVTLIVGALGFIATAVRTVSVRRRRAAESRKTRMFMRYGDIPLAKHGGQAYYHDVPPNIPGGQPKRGSSQSEAPFTSFRIGASEPYHGPPPPPPAKPSSPEGQP